MALATRLDAFGKTGWIVLMIAGFLLFWPIGLGMLGFLICSGRLQAWFGSAPRQARYDDEADFWRDRFREPSFGNGPAPDNRPRPARREEERDFQDYLQRLRRAKDRQYPAAS